KEMAVLKLSTPGVYVQEIPSIPPSVAEVETAIPAFLGYTEKADRLAPGDLKLIANKINNLAEYVQFYGGAATEKDDSVTIDLKDHGSNSYDIAVKIDPAKNSKHSLYYSVKHFYDNGGGTCYIVSVDTYAGAAGNLKADDFIADNKGLSVVKEIDEVTLLVIPEAANIDQGDNGVTYKTVVQKMIEQAAELKDRFALIDPYKVTPKDSTDPNGDIDGDVKIIR